MDLLLLYLQLSVLLEDGNLHHNEAYSAMVSRRFSSSLKVFVGGSGGGESVGKRKKSVGLSLEIVRAFGLS